MHVQWCLTLCDPMDCRLPGSSVHGISRQEFWSGLPFSAPENLLDPGIEPAHSLFTKNKNDQIKFVASHIQALNQTKGTRQKLIPNATEIECTDTAYAAKMLAEEKYPNTYAIICRKNTGLFYNLFLLAENIEDNPENKTTFGLFKLKN